MRTGLEAREILEVGEEREADLGISGARVEQARRELASSHLLYVERQAALSRLQQELSWRTGLLTEARNQIEALRSRAAEVGTRLEELQAQVEPQQAQTAYLANHLNDLRSKREEIGRSEDLGNNRLNTKSPTTPRDQMRFQHSDQSVF